MTESNEPRRLTDELREQIKTTYTKLQANTPGFIVRRPQSQMIGVAARTLASPGAVALIEAGTGVGKSLGYLTAGVPVAIATGHKLVLSTGTVALQSQLFDRDVPAFLQATGISASVALLKGRGRYFCPYKAGDSGVAATEEMFGDLGPLYDAPLSDSDQAVVGELRAAFDRGRWAGDLDSPPIPVPPAVRPHITTNAAGCLGGKCPFIGACPALQARKTALEAQIVVVNHALLLSALSMVGETQEPLLGDPAKMLLVVDEGHHLPAVAVETGAAAVALGAAARRLVKMAPLLARVFATVEAKTLGGFEPADVPGMVAAYAKELKQLKIDIETAWTPDPSDKEPLWRASHGRLPETWVHHCGVLKDLASDLAKLLGAASTSLSKSARVSEAERGKLITALGLLTETMSAQVMLWSTWAGTDPAGEPPHARWLTLTRDGDVVCHCSPSSASRLLRELVWGQVDSAIVTSATISAGGDFATVTAEMGVPPGAEQVSLPSPFDLQNQAKLIVPAMASQPQDKSAHTREVADYLTQHLRNDTGNLVLFTSRARMREVFDLLPASITAQVLLQGQEPLQQLVKRHVERIDNGMGSILFGMNSLGEGVDLRGAYCTQVFITSLTFPVPTDPILATLSEWYEQRRMNSFVKLAVPHAIRVLTQFAGRLIRSATDTGEIHILDSRLLSKRYGTTILNALPPFGRQLG
ncbi:ATP-dependent DNA helicase DinG [Xanthomonas sacchari]|uniref:ATP-dependent DNA helicase DinG n=1 Tax=Xanthomonas sacchari TaxID=56458 RepID=A0ABT3DUT8_9XANT|nr:ATP-dependent DNA helicase DinG [Xanthomonas sacchari]MCW0399268.1 ATP-dependent DNA helicase DinG [Xanthomonas sacchari]